jgi:hypothetical protein
MAAHTMPRAKLRQLWQCCSPKSADRSSSALA